MLTDKGSDTILLIVAILDSTTLTELINYSRALGMEPLVEVATEEEAIKAVSCGALVIGVNNRDLNTFVVDPARTSRLSQFIQDPKSILLALSGVLVGEALMKAEDKIFKIQELLGIDGVGEIKPRSTGPLVKICGITNAVDYTSAIDNGADFVGFIFEKSSPRYVDPSIVESIITTKFTRSSNPRSDAFQCSPVSAKQWFGSQSLPSKRPLCVGVFTNHSADEINEITDRCGLDLIQCHTFRDSEFHRLLNRPIIQVLSVDLESSEPFESLVATSQSLAGTCVGILLDTSTRGLVGGTGQVFDWTLVKKFSDFGIPVWMAGGINPDNVQEALKYNPYCVDVSSGVESTKGKKDLTKLRDLLFKVKQK